ncbi:MAG: hypothetical protein ABJP45_18630 [Cyclobacteriaceae bacterium]
MSTTRQIVFACFFLFLSEQLTAQVNNQQSELQRELYLSDSDFKQLESSVVQKFRDLGKYVSNIADRNTLREEAIQSMDYAIKYLFEGEHSIIQVSSISRPNRPPISLRVRTYFKNLLSLKYDRIEIEWYKVRFTSHLRRDANGNYSGIVEIHQRFSGYLDNKLIYTDNTVKQGEVVVDVERDPDPSSSDLLFSVKIKDIGVKATER